jgi:citrate lyase subunit beta/citryl-CoA lyase
VIGRARSWLYVPAHRPELLDKAMTGLADAVVYDLEDAVPAEEKETARANAADAVGKPQAKPLWVRVNAADTTWGQADIAALTGSGVAGVRVPKCADIATVSGVADRLGAPVHLLVESALGVENAFALARGHPLIAAVSLGEADLLADLRARDTSALEWARQRIIVANRAAGLPNPPHAVWTDLADTAGLLADTESARDRGFFGRSVLHPSQIEPVNQTFAPSRAEIEQARRLLDSLDEHAGEGAAAWIDETGRFVDPAVVARSRWLVELDEHIEEASSAGRRAS